MVAGQLRVAVIGSQTCHAGTPLAYTVYRTSANYRGLCYHRLIRFSRFLSFAKRLKLANGAEPITVKLPPKIWWSRKASLKAETVEARQVILNEFMQQVASRPLTPRTEERLMKLLQVGDYAPQEEEDRVINSRLSSKQHSATPTEPSSEIMGNPSIQTAAEDEDEEQSGTVANVQVQHDSLTDGNQQVEDDGEELQLQPQQQNGAKVSFQRADSEASTNPASDDVEPRDERSLSAPLTPPMQVATRPMSMSLRPQNVKRENADSELASPLKEGGGRDSIGSYASTPERHFFSQIKNCNASIVDIVDSSRKLEVRIREKQAQQVA
ncbi:hypothetical protein PF005_g11878 [Phytophthora fragariae]|uniref:PX domain-containing protein n=2 Tax=Phytophthora TaxID=4783 RepID=A0A6A3FXH4_9STRA|nr:hypothetical protein PF003_g23940 [Phytophthora fragariae]KAE9037591.1 hypothetical protein PR002_g6478 [Phytophthora rubi]KAE8949156.1 hypothetical protein PF009_g1272 [Phytophthora fragariae]KAE9014363.1 hypothetical protein PF011_g8087 [Phytophthora fragariae]KAE9051612.1 hypothetical protein PR001_g1278 [Phytophthora rubi]